MLKPPDVKSWLTGEDPGAGKDWGWEEKEADDRMGWLDSITASMDMNLSNLQEIVEDRGAWHTVYEITKNWTRPNDWIILTELFQFKNEIMLLSA